MSVNNHKNEPSGAVAVKETSNLVFWRTLPVIFSIFVVFLTIAFIAFYSFNTGKLIDKGKLIANQVTYILKSEMHTKPFLWKYGMVKIIEYARLYILNDPDLNAIVVTDENGKVVYKFFRESEKAIAVSENMWVFSGLDPDNRLGPNVYVGISKHKVKENVLVFFLPALIGVILFSGFLYLFVNKTVRDSNARIRALFVELEKVKKMLEEANHTLELKVEERTAQLKIAYDQLESSKKQLESLSAKTITINEDEKARIARELHDGIGQALTAVRINLDLMGKVSSNNPDFEKFRLDTIKLVEQTVDETRRIVSGMRCAFPAEYGLTKAINEYVVQFSERTGIKFNIDMDCNIDNFSSSAVKTTIFRVLQEGLTNIARHSEARNVSLSLSQTESYINFEISDDGIGFDPGEGFNSNGNGLKGMKERVELLGGEFKVVSFKGKGTKLNIKIPVYC